MSVVNASFGAFAPRLSLGEDAEEALLGRARAGDASAFEEIVHRHRTRVYRLAYRMLRRREEAEDITQETFVKAFEALLTVREAAALQTWLCRIAASLCLSRLRSASYRREVSTETLSLHAAEVPAPEETAFGQVVRETVAQLPAHYRLLVEACYVEGLSYKETANLTGVEVHTLKTRLFRARRFLRGRLAEALGRERRVVC